jgi:hypothetical protein
MAEEYVNKDQHRADLAELRLELKEEVSGLRHDVAVLSKVVDLGFADLRREMGDLRREMGDVRQEMRAWRTTTQQQMWVIVGGIILALMKMVFFP